MKQLPEPAELADDVDRLRAALAAATADASALAAGPDPADATALVPAGTNLPADHLKAAMATRTKALAQKAAEVASLRCELEAAMKAQLAAADAVLKPLEAQMKRLREGIWTVNLYLGRDEEIVTIRGGEPAAADTPLTVRQAVLAMDEETASLAERGGIDFTNLDLFDEWICDPAHLAQVAPEERCVVVLRPRRHGKDYGNPWESTSKNAENARSWWLMRNGERLYRMTTDLQVGDRLIPRRDEFTALFRTRIGDIEVDLEPGSAAWVRAEAAQDARQRHYMRCALVLQGLIDRTTVFHPLPGGQPFSLLHPEAYDAGKVLIVTDDDTTALGTGRMAFRQWLAERNAKLRPGMRIIGDFGTQAFRHTNEYMRSAARHHSRVSPRSAGYPPSHVVHRLDGWRDVLGEPGLVFHYARTHKEWLRDRDGNEELRAPKTKASCVVVASDDFIVPFDLVTIDEMRTYLAARGERHEYATMMPLLHAAIAAKEAEASAEAPMRHLLMGEIAKRYDVAVDDDLKAAVAELVDEWKMGNRWHRPLVASALSPDGADPTTEAKAISAIVTAYGQRLRCYRGDDAAVVARLRAHDPDVMFVGRARSGRYLAFAPQPRRYGPDAAAADVYVREHQIDGHTGRGRIRSREWVLPGVRANRLATVHATDRWQTWARAASAADVATDDEIAALAADARRGAVDGGAKGLVVAATHDHRNRCVEVWELTDVDQFKTLTPDAGRYIDVPYVVWRATWTRRPGAAPTLGALRPVRYAHGWRLNDDHLWGPVWDGRSRHRDAVWVCDQAMADVAALRARLRDIQAEGIRRAGAIRDALRALERQWEARAEAEAYARFVEDYGDDSLWDGHRKTLDLRYPHRGRASHQVLHKALGALVNAGRPLEGTVGELWAAAAVLGAVAPDGCPVDLAGLALPRAAAGDRDDAGDDDPDVDGRPHAD